MIPTILRQLLNSDRVELGATAPQRDFTFVTDTVRGFLALAEAPDAIGQTVNLGSQTTISIGDLAELCMRVTGTRKPIVPSADRQRPAASEVDRLLASAERAQALSGWRPNVSLEAGIARTAEYLASRPSSREAGYAI